MNLPMTIVKMKSIPNLRYGSDAKIFKLNLPDMTRPFANYGQ